MKAEPGRPQYALRVSGIVPNSAESFPVPHLWSVVSTPCCRRTRRPVAFIRSTASEQGGRREPLVRACVRRGALNLGPGKRTESEVTRREGLDVVCAEGSTRRERGEQQCRHLSQAGLGRTGPRPRYVGVRLDAPMWRFGTASKCTRLAGARSWKMTSSSSCERRY